MSKIYAYYLPQFHRTAENDEWWGEGFTEWVAVKNAVPLFDGHRQPKQPKKYYDLLQRETMAYQSKLMKTYGIDGLCFYHYYFENGRKMLEKPAENLLRWKDIDMPFCFYWANQSWSRTWSNISDALVWTNNSSKDDCNRNGSELLLKQAYGDEQDWIQHLTYLLPFFQDERYIRIDDRPVFMILNPDKIDCMPEMKECWDRMMDERGLPRVYFIGRGSYAGCLDGCMQHEPQMYFADGIKEKYDNGYGIKSVIDYDRVWNQIIASPKRGENYYYGGFVGYDDTPRRGNAGTVVVGETAQKFKKYLVQLLIKAANSKNDIVFLNAWNEWGEGMYLEPDVNNGDAYLRAVKEAKEFVEDNFDIFDGTILESKRDVGSESINYLQSKNERYKNYWIIMRDWLWLNIGGKSIAEYFISNDIRQIAIYGMGMLGKLLFEELKKQGVNVLYGIDQDCAKEKEFDILIYTLEDDLPEVEIIVVTVDYMFKQIKSRLREKGEYRVVSLKEVIRESNY